MYKLFENAFKYPLPDAKASPSPSRGEGLHRPWCQKILGTEPSMTGARDAGFVRLLSCARNDVSIDTPHLTLWRHPLPQGARVMVALLTFLCLFATAAEAKICFLPDGSCGTSKITGFDPNPGGCQYKSRTEAEKGMGECEEAYSPDNNPCWYRRCASSKEDIFDDYASCQKGLSQKKDKDKHECNSCGSCYKLAEKTTKPDDTTCTTESDCISGLQVFEKDGTVDSNNNPCGICKPIETCTGGYSTDYQSQSDCKTGETFSSNGTANGKVCGKCTPQTYTPETYTITALSYFEVYDNPAQTETAIYYSTLADSSKAEGFEIRLYAKDLISGDTDDNTADAYEIDEEIHAPTGQGFFTTIYNKSTSEYESRGTLTGMDVYIGGKVVYTSAVTPFYTVDYTPQTVSFTYNNQQFNIVPEKRIESNVSTCPAGYDSVKPSANVFIYTESNGCYKATGCVENNIVSATKASSLSNSLHWKNTDADAVAYTGKTCYINWPTNILFNMSFDANFNASPAPIWPLSSSGIFWIRGENGQKVNVKSVKDKFYLKSINISGEKFDSGITFDGYYCSQYGNQYCYSNIRLSWPDGYVQDFGDELLPGVNWNNPLYYYKKGGFTNGDNLYQTKSVVIKSGTSAVYEPFSYPTKANDTMTLCYILDDNNQKCKDIDIIPYVKAEPEYGMVW